MCRRKTRDVKEDVADTSATQAPFSTGQNIQQRVVIGRQQVGMLSIQNQRFSLVLCKRQATDVCIFFFVNVPSPKWSPVLSGYNASMKSWARWKTSKQPHEEEKKVKRTTGSGINQLRCAERNFSLSHRFLWLRVIGHPWLKPEPRICLPWLPFAYPAFLWHHCQWINDAAFANPRKDIKNSNF